MIAVVNRSKARDADVVFWAAACDLQARQCAAAWDVPYVPVIACALGRAGDLSANVRVMTIDDSLDVSGALGYHTDVGGVIYGRVLYQGPDTSITLSHEVLEETVDPDCSQWAPGYPSGGQVAKEVSDPVEGDSYALPAVVAGETRQVLVSNYVLPAWFGGASGPYDIMGRLSAPWTMTAGGYMVVDDSSGEHSVFARHLAAARVVGNPGLSRIQNPYSRTLRRLAGSRA
jgi:hypothetical protein